MKKMKEKISTNQLSLFDENLAVLSDVDSDFSICYFRSWIVCISLLGNRVGLKMKKRHSLPMGGAHSVVIVERSRET